VLNEERAKMERAMEEAVRKAVVFIGVSWCGFLVRIDEENAGAWVAGGFWG
jgi:hypothetical protein